nr:uncharacterized mitochondrial protein AtMg00810-like [Tanacetum cinerariifolium]
MKDKFQMSSIGELTFFLGLQVKQKDDGIFTSQDKYVAKILRKFGFTDVKSASTPFKIEKPLLKDLDGEDVDVHIYRSMIGSLMYLTSSRPDIMFVVYAGARFQVTLKVSHLHAVKRIFKYLKGKPHLVLWYPRDSPFNLVAYYDSDYAGASLDMKFTTGGCQFLGCRLISWQCKKQTVVAISSIEAKYVVAASCCAQVLWIQNQLLDYGACPHHGFSELHQLDTFYNSLNVNDQDSSNSAAGGNFLDKMPADCLKIIKRKSKVRQTRAKAVVAKLLNRIVLPTVVITHTKTVPRPAETSIKTTSNSMCHKPQQPITVKETPVSALRWLQIRFDLPDFRPFRILKTISIGGIIFIKTEVEISTNLTSLKANSLDPRYIKANDAVLRNIQNQGQSTQNQCQSTQNQLQTMQNQLANLTDMMAKLMSANTASSSGSGTLPGNTVTNPKEDLKGITTRSGVAYQGPTIPTPSKVAKQGTEVTKNQVQTSSSQSTTPVQPTATQSEPETPVSEPLVAPVSASMPNLKPSIPYPSRRDTERRRMDECLALADLGASINLMPLSVWKGLSLPELTPTCMTLELADRTKSKPFGIAKDVKVKVGMFHFPADFVVVDFEPDPRVPLILWRCFLKTSRALIDVNKGELTLRIGNEAITYNLDQTSRYSAYYDQITVNKIDVTDEACEEYSQEVLGLSDVTTSGSPTPSDDLIVSTTSPMLTPFGDSDFLLFEEADAFLGLEDDPDSP